MHFQLKNIKYVLPHTLLLFGILWMHFSEAEGVVGVIGNTGNLGQNSLIQVGNQDLVSAFRIIAINIFDAVKIAFNGVALLALAYVGYLWISSMGDEEKQNDGKYRFILIFVGLFLINIPELLYTIISGSSYTDENFWRKVRSVSTRDPGGIFNESALNGCNYFFCTQNFWGNSSTIAIMKFLEVLMIATAVLMFTWGGFTMLFRGNSEDRADKGKMRIIYGVVALLLMGFVESIYRSVFFGGALNAKGIVEVLLSAGNFAIFFAGPVAIIFIIIGAYYYITAGGNEESADKGKRIILYTFLATILLILGYTIVIELVSINLI